VRRGQRRSIRGLSGRSQLRGARRAAGPPSPATGFPPRSSSWITVARGEHARGDARPPELGAQLPGAGFAGRERRRSVRGRGAQAQGDHRVRGRAPGQAARDDERTDGAWSGDISALVRLIRTETHAVQAINPYLAWKSSFKPAAPNLTEAERAEILAPERTHSIEGGIKTRWLLRQLSFD